MLPHKLQGVIFDLDNTLVSSSLNFDSIREALGCSKEIYLLNFVDSLPVKQKRDANKVLVDYEINDALSANKLAGTDELLALLSKLSITYWFLLFTFFTHNMLASNDMPIK